MIEEEAIITQLDGNYAIVQSERKTACGQCSVQKGCGTSVLAKWLAPKLSTMRAMNRIQAEVGDRVIVGLDERALLKSAFIVYLMPLVLALFFAIIVSANIDAQHGLHEILVLFAAVAGLVVAGFFLKFFQKKIQSNPQYQPVLLRKVETITVKTRHKNSIIEGF